MCGSQQPKTKEEVHVAQEIIVLLKDDIDGTEAVGTTKFAYDGVHYEIDLSEANKAKMDKAMSLFVKSARRTGGRQVAGSKKSKGAKSKAQMIREWAIGEGLEVSSIGIVPKRIVEAYEQAHPAA